MHGENLKFNLACHYRPSVIFPHSRHQHPCTCHSLWRVFLCLRLSPLSPVSSTTLWRHPSLLHHL